jgi:hypothetical protein
VRRYTIGGERGSRRSCIPTRLAQTRRAGEHKCACRIVHGVLLRGGYEFFITDSKPAGNSAGVNTGAGNVAAARAQSAMSLGDAAAAADGEHVWAAYAVQVRAVQKSHGHRLTQTSAWCPQLLGGPACFVAQSRVELNCKPGYSFVVYNHPNRSPCRAAGPRASIPATKLAWQGSRHWPRRVAPASAASL